MNERMSEWMNECMNAWMDKWMNEWIDPSLMKLSLEEILSLK